MPSTQTEQSSLALCAKQCASLGINAHPEQGDALAFLLSILSYCSAAHEIKGQGL